MEEGAEAYQLPRVQVRHLLHHTLHVTPSTLELEEFHQEAFPTSTSAPLATSPVVAAILREAITEVAVRQSLTVGRLVGQVAVDIRYKAKVVERQVEVGREALEVVNSYRPDVPLSFAVDKMDQVDVDSGSDEEEKEEVKETVVNSDDDMEEVSFLQLSSVSDSVSDTNLSDTEVEVRLLGNEEKWVFPSSLIKFSCCFTKGT